MAAARLAPPTRPTPRGPTALALASAGLALAGVAVWGLCACVPVLGLIAFWPVPVDRGAATYLNRWLRQLHRWGVPPWFDYGVVEFSSNVVLFAPLGALVAIILGRRLWWGGAVAGFMLSTVIELGQMAFLPARFPSAADVAANTIGAMAGALAARLFMARREAVRSRRPPRTL